jgi:hypothetical protein
MSEEEIEATIKGRNLLEAKRLLFYALINLKEIELQCDLARCISEGLIQPEHLSAPPIDCIRLHCANVFEELKEMHLSA